MKLPSWRGAGEAGAACAVQMTPGCTPPCSGVNSSRSAAATGGTGLAGRDLALAEAALGRRAVAEFIGEFVDGSGGAVMTCVDEHRGCRLVVVDQVKQAFEQVHGRLQIR